MLSANSPADLADQTTRAEATRVDDFTRLTLYDLCTNGLIGVTTAQNRGPPPVGTRLGRSLLLHRLQSHLADELLLRIFFIFNKFF